MTARHLTLRTSLAYLESAYTVAGAIGAGRHFGPQLLSR